MYLLYSSWLQEEPSNKWLHLSELLLKQNIWTWKPLQWKPWNKTNGVKNQLLTLCSTKGQLRLWFLWFKSIGCPGLKAGHCHFTQEGWHHQNDSLTDALNTWHTRSIFGLSCPPDHKLGVVRKHSPAVKMHNGTPLLMQKERSIEKAELWIWNMGYIFNHQYEKEPDFSVHKKTLHVPTEKAGYGTSWKGLLRFPQKMPKDMNFVVQKHLIIIILAFVLLSRTSLERFTKTA